MDAAGLPSPPSHLSTSSRVWWTTVVERYVLEPHHLRLLQLACEAWDRGQAAREQLAAEGLTVASAHGGVRPHPCVAIERDARLGFARLVRELDLDVEPPASSDIRPPGLISNSRRPSHARKASLA
jgi:P27 family predicted phage terminase small subunit